MHENKDAAVVSCGTLAKGSIYEYKKLSIFPYLLYHINLHLSRGFQEKTIDNIIYACYNILQGIFSSLNIWMKYCAIAAHFGIHDLRIFFLCNFYKKSLTNSELYAIILIG